MSSTEQMSPDHFILCLTAALKSPEIMSQLKLITHPTKEEFADLISGEVHKQLQPFKEKLDAQDSEIKSLKKIIDEQTIKLDQLEQHGRRDSLRIVGLPESNENDDTDAAVLSLCESIRIEPAILPTDIAVSHRVGKSDSGQPRQVLVKFATRNVRERVFRAKKNIKTYRAENSALDNVFINEDLTQYRANLARKARQCKNLKTIDDTWTIYGKIMVKDTHGVKPINSDRELEYVAQNGHHQT